MNKTMEGLWVVLFVFGFIFLVGGLFLSGATGDTVFFICGYPLAALFIILAKVAASLR